MSAAEQCLLCLPCSTAWWEDLVMYELGPAQLLLADNPRFDANAECAADISRALFPALPAGRH